MNDVAWVDHPFDGRNGIKRSPRSFAPAVPVSATRNVSRLASLTSNSVPPTPSSTPLRLTRKRASSINTDAANDPRIENLNLNSAASTAPTPAEEKACLCQPDPKIPRPRNAFILYRQHYQAQVVANHPGLANPEISKIIGEQWRDQPIEVKNEWKRLAEEEKHRHQRQYPDYRYQPRRAGALNRSRVAPSSEDPIRCPKCKGRYISTPSTPITPFTSSAGSRKDLLPAPFAPTSKLGTLYGNMSREERAQLSRAGANQVRTGTSHQQQAHRRPAFAQQSPGALRLGSPHNRQDEMEIVENSPDIKRRRFNGGLQSQSAHSPYDPAQQRVERAPMSAVGYIEDRRPLPSGQATTSYHQRSGMMEPPPRSSPAMHHFQMAQTHQGFDESLRLPPLQTQGSSALHGPSRTSAHQRTDIQSRSVEAMVMTIPFVNKIKVLAKISPPLLPPGPTSPVHKVRGAVIAVEGDAENYLVAEVGNFIKESLNKEPEFFVKTWLSGKTDKSTSADTKMGGTSTPPIERALLDNPFLEYLHTIESWHKRSAEITSFITTSPSDSTNSAIRNNSNTNDDSAPMPSSALTALIKHASTSDAHAEKALAKSQVPIALLPAGFSLSTSDRFASCIPINDAYAPVDHWQWMATLWRGIVGPDLTVYVKGVYGDDRDAVEELNKHGGVECRTDCAAIVIRVPIMEDGKNAAKGSDDAKAVKVMIEDKTLRRLGFEVMEMVRSGMAGAGGK